MASTVLKCSACNIVINEVLAFMHNKMNVMDEEGLVQICRTAFSTDDIFEAKKLLFDAVPIRKIKRRKKESKSTRDLEDVIELLKHIDATDPERLPIFVARDLHKLPPVTFDHVDVTRLLRDINLLKDELITIKSTYVTKKQLKDTFECSREKSLNYINTKRGAYALNSYSCDSGPMGLQPLCDESTATVAKCSASEECAYISSISPSRSTFEPAFQGHSPRQRNEATAVSTHATVDKCVVSSLPEPEKETAIGSRVEANTAVSCITKPVECSERASVERAMNYNNINDCNTTERTMADIVRESLLHERVNEDEKWQTVQRKKNVISKNRFISETGRANFDNKFRAAPNKVPLYISNVCKETSESDIVEYIKNKTSELVTLEKIQCKKEKSYNSFKLFVARNKLHIFLNTETWPEGICFRRFITLKKSTKSGKSREVVTVK
ncbi:unnamed protein product [Colias eurytheme]|nr:unnamed protein product [Colias eurytheme]